MIEPTSDAIVGVEEMWIAGLLWVWAPPERGLLRPREVMIAVYYPVEAAAKGTRYATESDRQNDMFELEESLTKGGPLAELGSYWNLFREFFRVEGSLVPSALFRDGRHHRRVLEHRDYRLARPHLILSEFRLPLRELTAPNLG